LESTRLFRFRRTADGVLGVGFLQTDSGRKIFSVAWPIGEPKKYEADNPSDLDGYGVEVLDETSFGSNEKMDDMVASLNARSEQLQSKLDEAGEKIIELEQQVAALKAELAVLPQPVPPAPPAPQPQGDEAPSGGSDASEEVDEAAAIEAYLKANGTEVTNKSVIEALKEKGVLVQSAQVTAAKNKLASETVG
jgi:hypothetical protein